MTLPGKGRHPGARLLILRAFALGCFCFYIGWNIYWLLHGRVPESILLGVFGIPAPSTGMTRSLIALVRGEWVDSLLWNPFTLPVGFLFTITLRVAIGNILWRKGRVLPRRIVQMWAACLGGAWLFKLVQGPAWW